jgi:hypothetical protein
VEARDGIEPPNKALQTLPFSFWVPRHLFYDVIMVKVMLASLRVVRAAILFVPSKTLLRKINGRTRREPLLVNEHTSNRATGTIS